MNRAGSAPFPATHRWPVTLTHDGVTLRPIRRRDNAAWDQLRRNNWDWLKHWEATPPPGPGVGPRSFSGLVRTLGKQAREGQSLPWVIAYDATGGSDPRPTMVGQLTVSGITMGSARWGQIGYWIDQGHAGRGIVPTAVTMACDYAFTVMGLHRIEIAIRPENEKSLRVVRKLGFREEGLRPRYLHIDGGWRDHLVFVLTAEEVPVGLRHRWRRSTGDQRPS